MDELKNKLIELIKNTSDEAALTYLFVLISELTKD